jgi:hypothetical protein
MITISQTNDTVKFVLYTLGISEEMICNEQVGKIATHTILNLIEAGIYTSTKNRLIQILNSTEIDLTDEEFYAFCILVDFTSRCFISDIFYEKLKTVHETRPFDGSASFSVIKMFYLKHATNYFKRSRSSLRTKYKS